MHEFIDPGRSLLILRGGFVEYGPLLPKGSPPPVLDHRILNIVGFIDGSDVLDERVVVQHHGRIGDSLELPTCQVAKGIAYQLINVNGNLRNYLPVDLDLFLGAFLLACR